MRRISVLGCGYVGLVTGAGIASFGNKVLCTDSNIEKIKNLKKMILPFSEPGLFELIEKAFKSGLISFSSDLHQSIADSDAVIIAVQTPQNDDGSADISFVLNAAEDISRHLIKPAVIIIKSTVPIGTAAKVKNHMNSLLKDRNAGFNVEIVSNPEFLREGAAVQTFLYPDRIVVGSSQNAEVISIMNDIYKTPVERGVPVIRCSNETAETIKYAANSFLAMKIAYINQIALLCEKTGADIKIVSKAVGSDERINPKFLEPGPGFGGSCFPKDTRALVKLAEDYNLDLSLIRGIYEANTAHKTILAEKAIRIMRDNDAKTLGIWGVSFKAGSQDMRNAPALDILPLILNSGIKIKLFDPKAINEAMSYFYEYEDMIDYCTSKEDALKGSDALMILTEWDCFKNADLKEMASLLNKKILMDYRNIYDSKTSAELGFLYYGVGI